MSRDRSDERERENVVRQIRAPVYGCSVHRREGIREKDTDVEAREGLSVILHCPRGSLALFHPLIAVFILSLTAFVSFGPRFFVCTRARERLCT